MLGMLRLAALPVVCLVGLAESHAQKILFEDNFDNGLSTQWELVGLTDDDYRLRDGGLEMRVQPGKMRRETPMLKAKLPFDSYDTVIASVEVSLLDQFTEPMEFAGLFLTDEHGREFSARKQWINGFLLFTPGLVDFIGEEGNEGDPSQYTVKFWPANDESGPLRIIVRNRYAFFQVGPSSQGKFLNFFHSKIRSNEKERGFALTAAGGPEDKDHWVRFDNFRVTR